MKRLLAILLAISLLSGMLVVQVSATANPLDSIQVQAYPYREYALAQPIPVTAAGVGLTEGEDYKLTYTSEAALSYNAQVTVTGLGIYEGFEENYRYAILKRNIADAEITIESAGFLGMPLLPEVTVHVDGYGTLAEGTDYELVYENNVNVGTGTVRVIGKGNFYGSVEKEFPIELEATDITLPGNYLGKADGTLSDQVYYQEGYMTPGVFTGKIDSSYTHVVYYELYRIEGETPVLVTSKQSGYSTSDHTKFTYDFTSVYNSAAEAGGEVYMLAYSWVDSYNNVYAGVLALLIPAKVSNATTMTIERVEGTSDYNKAYLDLYGEDGNVENAQWTTSNATVATVEDGVVTLKSPGTATITAQHAGVNASYTVEVAARNISECEFFHYDIEEDVAYVACDYLLMTENVDYVKSVSVEEDVTVVTISGKGLFTGELVRVFNTQTGEAIGDTHSFDNSCDNACNDCDYTRTIAHDPAESWRKNQTHHWHLCSICGEKLEQTAHTVNAQDSNLCDVCGTICLTGDVDGDGEITDWDGVMMARYLAGWNVEVELAALDIDGDGEVTDWDGVILDRYLAGWNVTIG